MTRISVSVMAALVSVSLLSSQSSWAASATWDNGGGSNNWQTAANWSADTMPGATSGYTNADVATFSTAGAGTINLGDLINIRSISFGVGSGNANAFIIGDANDTLNLTNGGAITIGTGVTNTQQIGVAGTVISFPDAAVAQAYSFTNNSVTSGAKLNIAGNIVGNNSAAAMVLTLNGTNGGTVSGAISNGVAGGTVAVTKSGVGTWALTGANTYTGLTTVNAGGVLDIGGGTADGSITGSALSVGLAGVAAGGTLRYTRTGTNAQTFTSTTIAAGASTIEAAVSTGTINLGVVTRQFGGTVDFTGPGTITSGNAAGLMGGWATVGGTTWAVSGGAGNAITGLSSYNTSTAGSTAPGGNVDFQASNTTAWASQMINSLRFNTAAATTLTLDAGQVLTDSTGGILVTSAVGANTTTITGGAISGASGNGPLTIIQNNTSGELNIASTITGTASDGFTKSGAGTLTLSGNNTFVGRIFVNAGTLKLGSTTALGDAAATSSIVFSTGSTLDLNGFNPSIGARTGNNVVFYGDIINSSSTAVTFTTGWTGVGAISSISPGAVNIIDGIGDINFAGSIANGRLVKNGSANLIIGGANSNTSTTLVANGGTTTLSSSLVDGALRGIDINGNILTVNSGATVRMGANDQIRHGDAASGIVAVYGGTFDMNSKTDTVNGLQIGATDGSSAGTISDTGGTGVLTVTGTTTAFGTNRILATSGSSAVKLAGAATTFTKETSGTVTLSAVNTYTGATTVNAGTLIVSSSGGIAAASAITIASGGTLQYDSATAAGAVTLNGTLKGVGVLGNVTVNAGGFVKPGDSIGNLTVANFSLNATGTLAMEINGAGGMNNAGSTYDLLTVNGSLTLGGFLVADGTINATMGNLYFIINKTSAGAVSGLLNGVDQGGLITLGGQSFNISYAGDFASNSFTGGNDVVLQAVPEPSVVLLFGAGLLVVVLRLRRIRLS